MLISKLRFPAAVLLVVLALAGGATLTLLPSAAGQPATGTDAQQATPTPKAEDAFPGQWEWADGHKGGMVRILIANTDNAWTIQAWGKGGGAEIDQGKTSLTLLRDYEEKGATDDEKTMNKYGFAVWVHKHARSHVTLRMQNDRLIVEEYRIFTDQSGRPHYRSRYEFKKKK